MVVDIVVVVVSQVDHNDCLQLAPFIQASAIHELLISSLPPNYSPCGAPLFTLPGSRFIGASAAFRRRLPVFGSSVRAVGGGASG